MIAFRWFSKRKEVEMKKVTFYLTGGQSPSFDVDDSEAVNIKVTCDEHPESDYAFSTSKGGSVRFRRCFVAGVGVEPSKEKTGSRIGFGSDHPK